MALHKPHIPYGAYWSTPFCRWQGSLSALHSIELAARTARRFFELREVSPESFDGIVLGCTVPQRRGFYGAAWVAGMVGAPAISGPTVAQACATSVRALATAALAVEADWWQCVLGVTCDRTSNGPHVYYPSPGGTGGTGETEDPVLDNFGLDPWGGTSMIQTAENVAREAGISREEQDETTLLRYHQYEEALAGDRAFQRRYMVAAEVPQSKKKTVLVEQDEGIYPTTAEGLAKLRPVLDGGTVTYGTQTFPADGNAGIVVATKERAQGLSKDPAVTIRVLGFGEARVKKSFMPMAVVPAARVALDQAGIQVADCKAIKTHNPFAVNDIFFCRETGADPARVNRYGSPLIWGHPQGPTGTRAILELIEELVIAGGGYGLFTGCAAGDTSMAVVVEVG